MKELNAVEAKSTVAGAAGGGMGTLQALLTELSGVKKPRGFFNRIVRRTLGMRPKSPPKYRIFVALVTQATNGNRSGNNRKGVRLSWNGCLHSSWFKDQLLMVARLKILRCWQESRSITRRR